jgi:hypothetical protein
MPILRVDDPNGKNRHRAQAEYLEFARGRRQRHEDSDGKIGIQYLNYCGGRGAGKTTIAIIDMVNVAMVEAPGFRTFWCEPTFSDIERILLPELEQVVPRDLWRLVNKPGGYRFIEWASGHRTDLISRFAGNSNKRPGLGSNMIGGWFDEAATGWEEHKVNDIANSVRAPGAPYYFIAMVSTPLRNGFETWCKQESAHTVYATSWDNPHISKDVLDTRAASMSPEQVEQELKGRFVALDGRIWEHFVEKPWPEGNIIEGYEFDFSKPYWMSFDLGSAQSAAQVYQHIAPEHPITGERLMKGQLLCCVEEWVPNRMGFETLMKEMIERYSHGDPRSNPPRRVYIGHDANTKDAISHLSASVVLGQLGYEWTYPANKLAGKDLQRSHLSGLMYQNRFVVAANINNRTGEYEISRQYHGERKMRGILNCIRTDTYPDPSKDGVFVKDKRTMGVNAVEDDRDCMSYCAICHIPPSLFNADFYRKK